MLDDGTSSHTILLRSNGSAFNFAVVGSVLIVLPGLAIAQLFSGLPGGTVPAACAALLALCYVRCALLAVSIKGDVVMIRNVLRTYQMPISRIEEVRRSVPSWFVILAGGRVDDMLAVRVANRRRFIYLSVTIGIRPSNSRYVTLLERLAPPDGNGST